MDNKEFNYKESRKRNWNKPLLFLYEFYLSRGGSYVPTQFATNLQSIYVYKTGNIFNFNIFISNMCDSLDKEYKITIIEKDGKFITIV